MAVQHDDEILSGGPPNLHGSPTDLVKSLGTDFNVRGADHWRSTAWKRAAAVCSQKWRAQTKLYMEAVPGLESAAAYFSTAHAEASDHAVNVARAKKGKDAVWEAKYAEDQLRQVYVAKGGDDAQFVLDFEAKFGRAPSSRASVKAAVQAMTFLQTAQEWPQFQQRVQTIMEKPPATLADAALQIAFVAKGFVGKDAFPVPPHCPECIKRRQLAPPELVEPGAIRISRVYAPTPRGSRAPQQPPQQPLARMQQEARLAGMREAGGMRARHAPGHPRPEPQIPAQLEGAPQSQPPPASNTAFPAEGYPPSDYYGPAQPQPQPFYAPPFYAPSAPAPAPFNLFGNPAGVGLFGGLMPFGGTFTDSGNTTTIIVNDSGSASDGYGGYDDGYGGYDDGDGSSYDSDPFVQYASQMGLLDTGGGDEGDDGDLFMGDEGDDGDGNLFTGGYDDVTSGGYDEGDDEVTSGGDELDSGGYDDEGNDEVTSGGDVDEGDDEVTSGGDVDDGDDEVTSGGVGDFLLNIIQSGLGHGDEVPPPGGEDEPTSFEDDNDENVVPIDEEPEDGVAIGLFGTGSADVQFDVTLFNDGDGDDGMLTTGGAEDDEDGTLFEDMVVDDDESLLDLEPTCDEDASCALE